MGEPELEVGVARLDALVCQPVATQQGHQGAGGGAQVTLSRRPLAANVALVGNDRRLVDRHPKARQLPQFVRDAFGVTGEALSGLGRLPPGPPVVAMIAAFDLVCCGGGAPVKALGKSSGAHRAGAGRLMMAKTTARITSARTRTTTTPMGPTTAATARSVDKP